MLCLGVGGLDYSGVVVGMSGEEGMLVTYPYHWPLKHIGVKDLDGLCLGFAERETFHELGHRSITTYQGRPATPEAELCR